MAATTIGYAIEKLFPKINLCAPSPHTRTWLFLITAATPLGGCGRPAYRHSRSPRRLPPYLCPGIGYRNFSAAPSGLRPEAREAPAARAPALLIPSPKQRKTVARLKRVHLRTSGEAGRRRVEIPIGSQVSQPIGIGSIRPILPRVVLRVRRKVSRVHLASSAPNKHRAPSGQLPSFGACLSAEYQRLSRSPDTSVPLRAAVFPSGLR